MASNSSSRVGSILVRAAGSGREPLVEALVLTVTLAGGMIDCIGPCCCADVERWPRCSKFPKPPPKPPRRLCDFSATGTLSMGWLFPPPEFPAAETLKGFREVFLCALPSLSSIFFLNVFASLSSANDNPAKQSSSSNVWKNIRSWL